MAIVAFRKARRLRERVDVEVAVNTVDEWRDTAQQWVKEQTVWAAIEPMSLRDQERLVGAQTQQEITHKVTVRSISGLTSDKRFKFNGSRILEILSIADRRERGVLMEVLCKEVVEPNG